MFGRSLLRSLRAVLAASLTAIFHASGVEHAADDVIADAREVSHAAAADEHDRVLLEGVLLARDVARDLLAVHEADAGHGAERGVRLLRRLLLHREADAALLGAAREHGRLRAPALRDARLLHELVDRRHFGKIGARVY